MKRKYRENVILPNGMLSRRQRAAAKEAMLWLLGRGDYNCAEMSEHLGLTEELVNQLADELARAGRLIRGERQVLRLRDPISRWWEGGQARTPV
ncbi:hypothetical protein [Desulfotomaculum copahuensis]|nr:hypothetical protein [Desulfotomaculum copahuensis]